LSLRAALALIGAGLMTLWSWSGAAWGAPASAVYKGPSDSRQIALTFDDNTQTARALATLRALEKNEVPATLFVIGSAVGSTTAINTEIVKGMNAGLFEVGDHSWSHPVLTGLSNSALAKEIGGGTDAFRTATGARTVPLFRPPYGSTDSRVAAAAGSEGFTHLVLWDVDPKDWNGKSASAIADHVISHAHAGAIVVMHLSAANTAAAIPTIVSTLRNKGYEFVKVSSMLKGPRLFLDVDGASEEGAAIARMVERGFMSGYDGNYFGPRDTITRAQVAKVATLVAGLHTADVENPDAPAFADVPPRRAGDGTYLPYPFDFVQEAAAAGLVQGMASENGLMIFNPTGSIARVQLASILARMVRGVTTRFLPEAAAQTMTFVDVPGYAADDVALVAALGLMTGYTDGRFRPWSGAERSQVAVAMSRYLALASLQPAD
jgi:peptidoglycan/xylan/chitin deacetylase (PgdA/CDA1 family)